MSIAQVEELHSKIKSEDNWHVKIIQMLREKPEGCLNIDSHCLRVIQTLDRLKEKARSLRDRSLLVWAASLQSCVRDLCQENQARRKELADKKAEDWSEWSW